MAFTEVPFGAWIDIAAFMITSCALMVSLITTKNKAAIDTVTVLEKRISVIEAELHSTQQELATVRAENAKLHEEIDSLMRQLLRNIMLKDGGII